MLPEARPAVLQGLQQHVCCNKRCKNHSPKRCKQCLGTCLQQRCESCSQGAASSVARQMTTDGLACSHSFSTASWSAVNSAFMLQQTLQKNAPQNDASSVGDLLATTLSVMLPRCLQQYCTTCFQKRGQQCCHACCKLCCKGRSQACRQQCCKKVLQETLLKEGLQAKPSKCRTIFVLVSMALHFEGFACSPSFSSVSWSTFSQHCWRHLGTPFAAQFATRLAALLAALLEARRAALLKAP